MALSTLANALGGGGFVHVVVVVVLTIHGCDVVFVGGETVKVIGEIVKLVGWVLLILGNDVRTTPLSPMAILASSLSFRGSHG